MKNAERNLDSRDGEASNATSWLCYSTSSFDYSYRPLRRLLLTSFLVLGVLMIGLSLRAHLPSNCPANSASACHRDSPSAEAQSRLRRETRWTKIYESISKYLKANLHLSHKILGLTLCLMSCGSAEKINQSWLSKVSSWCLKITEKVSFNIASEASKVCILCRNKLIKNAKKCTIC